MIGADAPRSLSTLLQIENDKELIEFTCPMTGLPIWPLIRVPVMRTIMSDWLFKSSPLSAFGQKTNFMNLAKNSVISSIYNWSYKANSRRSILIQSSGIGNYIRDGLIYDRLVGYFANALRDQTLVYQDKPKEELWKKYSFGTVLHKTPRNIINSIYFRIAVNHSHRLIARRVIDQAAINAASCISYEFDDDKKNSLCNSLAKNLALLPYASDVYANWLSKNCFKLLLKEDACYGGTPIAMIHAARLNGMVIAEYQHGAISKGHDAYNVSDALANCNSFKKVLPDYLLTYGKWWSGQTNMPIKKLAIGNPHLSEAIGRANSVVQKKDQVLLLGDGVETDLYLNLASRVLGAVRGRGMNVVFRPHPFERDKVKSAALPVGVKLDSHQDIYSSLKESRVVISEMSTGLFEAVGLVDKVLLWETDKSRFTFPEAPFTSFSAIDELVSLLDGINSSQGGCNKVAANDLWEANWKENYLRFVEGAVGQ